MKIITTAFAFFLIIFIPFNSFSQTDCNPYFLLEEGRKWTTANYTAKDKYRGKQSYEVKSLSKDDYNLTAQVLLTSYDKKDKMVMEKEVEFICENGIIELDMTKYMPEEAMEGFKDLDMEITFDALTIPEKLEVGEFLDDGGIDMAINGPMKMNMSVSIQDRKVIAKENIEVPAGTYDAFKINSIIKVEAMVTTSETKNIDWIAKDVGVIRSEQYDKNGKLKGYSVLTEIN